MLSPWPTVSLLQGLGFRFSCCKAQPVFQAVAVHASAGPGEQPLRCPQAAAAGWEAGWEAAGEAGAGPEPLRAPPACSVIVGCSWRWVWASTASGSCKLPVHLNFTACSMTGNEVCVPAAAAAATLPELHYLLPELQSASATHLHALWDM